MTLEDSFNLFVPQFSYLQNGNNVHLFEVLSEMNLAQYLNIVNYH
jgi:hypothetical protein